MCARAHKGEKGEGVGDLLPRCAMVLYCTVRCTYGTDPLYCTVQYSSYITDRTQMPSSPPFTNRGEEHKSTWLSAPSLRRNSSYIIY